MKESEAKRKLCPFMTQKVWSNKFEKFELVKTSCLTTECMFWVESPPARQGNCSLKVS